MSLSDFGVGAARETVVPLHSSGSSSRQWSALIERLSPSYDMRAVDLHGHGAQPAWPGRQPLALADEVTLVEPILREAGPVHLVGHSYGGVVALKVAELHPRSVRSLVAYEPVLFRWLYDTDPASDAACAVIEVAAAIRKALHARSYSGAARPFVDYWSGTGAWDVDARAAPPGDRRTDGFGLAALRCAVQRWSHCHGTASDRGADDVADRCEHGRQHAAHWRNAARGAAAGSSRAAAENGTHGPDHACRRGERVYCRLSAGPVVGADAGTLVARSGPSRGAVSGPCPSPSPGRDWPR